MLFNFSGRLEHRSRRKKIFFNIDFLAETKLQVLVTLVTTTQVCEKCAGTRLINIYRIHMFSWGNLLQLVQPPWQDNTWSGWRLNAAWKHPSKIPAATKRCVRPTNLIYKPDAVKFMPSLESVVNEIKHVFLNAALSNRRLPFLLVIVINHNSTFSQLLQQSESFHLFYLFQLEISCGNNWQTQFVNELKYSIEECKISKTKFRCCYTFLTRFMASVGSLNSRSATQWLDGMHCKTSKKIIW